MKLTKMQLPIYANGFRAPEDENESNQEDII